MKHSKRISQAALALVWVCASGQLFAADLAAEVVFAIGDVKISQGGQLRVVQRGDKIYAGDQLQTGRNGHIHLKTVDAGFISLRPASQLLIHQYHYDPKSPRENAVRFELKNGVVRSITGKAGEEAKDRFRLSTPVAAIGIRGTDFSVYTNDNETRVAVRSGGVAVSPFNASCSATALGPCSGNSVASLYAGNNSALLQVRAADAKPMLRQDKTGTLLPEAIAPALPEEQQSVEGKAVKTSQAVDYQELVTTAQQQASDKPVTPAVNPPTVQPVRKMAALEWGRWADRLQSGSGEERLMLAQGMQNTLFRTRGDMNLPERGQFDFNLTAANAIVSSDTGQAFSSLNVSQAKLGVDFERKEFTTALTVQGNELQAAVQLSATGGITSDGRMSAAQYWYGSNMTVNGALSGTGKEAAYLFQHSLQDGRVVSGATSWQR